MYGIVQAQEFVELAKAMKDSNDHGTYQGVVEEEARVELSDLSNDKPSS